MPEIFTGPDSKAGEFLTLAKQRAKFFYRLHVSELPFIAYEDYLNAAFEALEKQPDLQDIHIRKRDIDSAILRFLQKEREYQEIIADPVLHFSIIDETVNFLEQGPVFEERVKVREIRDYLRKRLPAILKYAEQRMVADKKARGTKGADIAIHQEIVEEVIKGKEPAAIAEKLHLAVSTITQVRTEFYKKVMLAYTERLRPEIFDCIATHRGKLMNGLAAELSSVLGTPITEEEALIIYHAVSYLHNLMSGCRYLLMSQRGLLTRLSDMRQKNSDEALTAEINLILKIANTDRALSVDMVARLMKLCE